MPTCSLITHILGRKSSFVFNFIFELTQISAKIPELFEIQHLNKQSTTIIHPAREACAAQDDGDPSKWKFIEIYRQTLFLSGIPNHTPSMTAEGEKSKVDADVLFGERLCKFPQHASKSLTEIMYSPTTVG